MLTADHRIKLIDFDIARQYQPGKHRGTVLMGTEGYAAPEQFGFSQTDARTDIYGLGVLFNYLLTGKFPVEEKAAGRMGEIISRCTAMNPEEPVSECYRTDACTGESSCTKIFGANGSVCDSIESC